MIEREIAAFRAWRRMRQPELAEKLGVHRVTIAKWESGKHPVPKWVHYALVGLAAELGEIGGEAHNIPPPS